MARIASDLVLAIVLVIAVVPNGRAGAAQERRQPLSSSFEVASIKRNNSADDNSARNLGAGGRMVFSNYSLRQLIMAAYDLEAFQVIGGPPWIGRDRFDVIAKAPSAAPLPELHLMLRSLLADRFKLAVHLEKRDMPRYTLAKANDDGRPGPALKRATVDCGPTGRGTPPPGSAPGPVAGCRNWISPTGIEFGGQTIAQLARVLSLMLERPVIDKTNLEGQYDLRLTFNPEAIATPGGAPPADPNAPSVFTALREQLGLRLDSERGPVDVVVIDSVDPPSEN